ncbi:hypothetical protein [Streptomyces sp. URMC 124]|uniref:hypothetical protein n=1 Tax=Streptomyces sp. URMC 124 TaxID=3423405 RepID=UPI003F1D66C7
MQNEDRRHVSLRRGGTAKSDGSTGEIRVPLDLYHLDERQGPIELVLSGAEAAELHFLLGNLLTCSAAAEGALLSARVADANRRSSGGGL